MAAITIDGVTKRFPGGHTGVDAVSLAIAHGELVVLVGPSGSGKSTMLRLIAGLEQPTAGRITVGGRDVTGVPPNERDLAMVFQSYALYPHKTVRENLAFGLRMRGVERATIEARVAEVAETLQIAALLDRRPAQLSGGQRQRVAVGRAIVREPQAFLFDEPLSNLDPALRLETRMELALLHRRLGATMVYVTHDQEEAMTLGQRIVVMRNGTIEQAAAPTEVYERPATAFVAQFIGSPPMNVLEASIDAAGRLAVPCLGGAVFDLRGAAGAGAEAGHGGARTASGAPLHLGVRPHDVAVVGDGEADVFARVSLVEPLGPVHHVHVRLEPDGPRMTVVVPADAGLAPEARIGLRLRSDRLHVFDVDTGRRRPVQVVRADAAQ